MRINTSNKFLVIIIVFLFIGASFASVSASLIVDNQVKSYIPKDQKSGLEDIFFDLKMSLLIKLALYPSLSACIINGDEVTWSNSYGFYDLDNRKSATENTIYNIASISKTFTGTALMQLYDQGLFDLDEDVNNYLPFNLRNPNFPDDPITFRMLLSHSSSLNIDSSDYYWLNFSADPPLSFYPYPWLEEHLIPGGKCYYSGRWSSNYRPGEYSMYANINFDIICFLVELISGENFVDYCKEHIFIPLGMYNTSFNLSELNINNVAIPYHYHNGEYLHINELSYMLGGFTPPDKYWRMRMYPAGGLYTTVSDLSHFFIAHMNGGVWNGVRILEEDTVEEMHRIQPPGNLDPNTDSYYGLAWTIGINPSGFNVNIMGHGGGIYGVHTWMYYIPDEEIGVVYFTNGDKYFERNVLFRAISGLMVIISLYQKGGFSFFSQSDIFGSFYKLSRFHGDSLFI
jgi:CubicO group peptidase (beta-lactamase class C family)